MVEIAEPTPETALVPAASSGLVVGADIADMSDTEFDTRLNQLVKRQERIDRIKRAAMVEGSDYGNVPGTNRPTLLKGGAEKLTNMNGLVARIETEEIIGRTMGEPPLRYRSQCWLHIGTFDGPIVGHGEGIASSFEKKYRYITERHGIPCPECGKEGLVKTRRNVWWHPFDAKPDGGCNENFGLDDPRLIDARAVTERIEHPNPWDNANTLLKMAEKRAHVDSVLRATGVSGLFTQDMEDRDPEPVEGEYREVRNDRPAPAPQEPAWSAGRFRYLMREHGVLMAVVKRVVDETRTELKGKKLDDLNAAELEALWTSVQETVAADAAQLEQDMEQAAAAAFPETADPMPHDDLDPRNAAEAEPEATPA